MNRTFAALLTATALALPMVAPLAAQADDAQKIKAIDVEVDLKAVANPAAAAYWGALEGDLEAAILAKLTDRVADDGDSISVDISEVALASGFEEAAGLADATLQGRVQQNRGSDGGHVDTYELSVDVNTVIPALPPGYDLAAPDTDTTKVYQALVDAFAASVVTNIK